MSNAIKKITKLGCFLFALIIINIIIINLTQVNICRNLKVEFTINAANKDVYQIFYSDGKEEWKEENAFNYEYNDINKDATIKCSIPQETQKIRIDLGNKTKRIKITSANIKYLWEKNNIINLVKNERMETVDILDVIRNNNNVIVEANGDDPYIVIQCSNEPFVKLEKHFNLAIKIILCLIFDLVALVFTKHRNGIFDLIKELLKNKRLIWNLSKNDFKTKYAGSYLGITWAFVQPIVTILVYWFVFEFGLRIGSPIPDVPYVLWFMAGLIPWFFFQEALLNATNCMLEYSYLVKKVVFKISILPIVKIISSLFVHLVFIMFLLFVGAIYGFYPLQFILQLAYYSFCMFVLVLSVSYATCAIVVFFRDLGQIINIFLQVGMWMSPIMWSYTIIPVKFQWIVKLNPMFYIVEGYRDSFITQIWFFEKSFQTIYFWIIIALLFIIGTNIFKRLKPHFADVL